MKNQKEYFATKNDIKTMIEEMMKDIKNHMDNKFVTKEELASLKENMKSEFKEVHRRCDLLIEQIAESLEKLTDCNDQLDHHTIELDNHDM
jgi:hypothetical protein